MLTVSVACFQLICMRFLNSLMACSSGQNARVFLQYELEMAGLDMSQLEKVCLRKKPKKYEETKIILFFKNIAMNAVLKHAARGVTGEVIPDIFQGKPQHLSNKPLISEP